VPDSAREKIAAIRTIGAADSERELAFGRELAARVLTGVAQTEDSELLARAKRRDTRFPYGMGVFFVPALYLSHALRARGVRGSRGAFQARRSRSKARQLSSDPSSDIRTIRTIGDFPPGYVADVLRQTGCQPGNSQQLAGVVVRYNEAGHVQELRPVATTLPPACDKAARYISRAGVLPAPWNMKPGARELLLVSMNDAALQCLAEAPSPATKGSTKPAVRVGGDIKPPKKIQDVRPQYPPDALAAGQQGSVILESQLTRSGCVRSAEVLKSAGTQFDIAALRAVGQWRFTPTLVRGEPVPVTLTVTVQFVTR
jgi:TonB family protein